jgi:hypothetical protein
MYALRKRAEKFPVITITRANNGSKSYANRNAPHDDPNNAREIPAKIASRLLSLRKALEK